MEFVLPEKIEEGYTRLRCPSCGVIYLVPHKYLTEGSIKLKAEYGPPEKETIISYNGQNYLALDRNGELKVTKYKIIPQRVIYQEERK